MSESDSNAIVYQIAQHMKESLLEVKELIKENRNELRDNTDKTEKILVQTLKTNGRVNKLEDETKDLKSIRDRQQWMMGVGITTVVLAGVIYTFILKDIQNQIETHFNSCCKSLQK